MRRQSESGLILRAIFFGILLGSGLILAIVGAAARGEAADGVFAVIFVAAGAVLFGCALYMLCDTKKSWNMLKDMEAEYRLYKHNRCEERESYELPTFHDINEEEKPKTEFSDTRIGVNTVKADDMRRLSGAGFDDIDLMLMSGEKLRQTMEKSGIDTSDYSFDF